MELTTIATVRSERSEPIDDGWDSVKSVIELDSKLFSVEALEGLLEFSHVEVVFFMHLADHAGKQARHPRGNKEWPLTGIFSQRAKDRPNRIGTTVCKLDRIEGLNLYVTGLDAIEGTPVVDLKPWAHEFGPRGPLRQPRWMTELMQNYW